MKPIVISELRARRFAAGLGRQALWPGRRLSQAGLPGTSQALRAIEALQLGPLNVVARSQDIALAGRVLDYDPEYLRRAQWVTYQQREFFDYGGGLFSQSACLNCLYWRPAMERLRDHPRWGKYARENPAVISQVLQALRERGPLGNRDFRHRGRKDTALALFALWLSSEIMIHHRKGFDRYYDLTERIAPAEHSHSATQEQAQIFFGIKAVAFQGLLREKRWPASLSDYTDRKLSSVEALASLSEFYEQNSIAPVTIQGSKETWLVLGSDLPDLEALESGQIPAQWRALGPSTLDEVTFLAPLEIVSARGRAKKLFGFEYIWEVYKPVEQRRWGYYTLPVLYGDGLVARIDLRLERKTATLQVQGFWLENEEIAMDVNFADAFGKGLVRFAGFVKARQVDISVIQPERLRYHIQQFMMGCLPQ